MSSYKNVFLITFPSILISLLPFFLITGPFLSDLSIVIISIIFLINIYSKKEFYFLNNKFFKFFLFFWLYLIANSLIQFYDTSSFKSLGYIRFGIFSLAFFYFIEKKEVILKWLFLSFLICFLILIIDGYLQYFFKYNLMGKEIDILSRRIRFLFNDDYILGSYLSRLFPIFLGLTFLIHKNSKQIILLISIIFILVEVLIFLSGERVAFFFNTLSAIFIILMINKFKKIRFFTLITSFFIVILISTYDDRAKQRIWDETINQIGIQSSNSELFIFSEIHQSHYLSAYKMFQDNKLLGIGFRNYRNFCHETEYKTHEKSCSTHPHNTFIQFLSETGLIGFSFLIYIFFFFIFKMLNHLKGALFKKKFLFNDFQICLFSALLITIWPLAPSGNFFNNWLSIVYYFPVGLILWSLKNKNLKTI